jgi:hypothetical protein
MSNYLKLEGTLKVAATSALTNLLASRPIQSVTSTGIPEFTSYVMEIADGTDYESVSLGKITNVVAIYAETDQEITLWFSGEPITFGPGFLFVNPTDFTTLFVRNHSGQQANIYIMMVGT